MSVVRNADAGWCYFTDRLGSAVAFHHSILVHCCVPMTTIPMGDGAGANYTNTMYVPII